MNARLEFLAALFLTSFAGLTSIAISMGRKEKYQRNDRFTQFGSLLYCIAKQIEGLVISVLFYEGTTDF